MKLKTGDNVRIIAGKDKGKEGKILQVFPRLGRVIVENCNMAVKHLRRAGQGQKISYPAPVHHSNVQLISPKTKETGRVGYKVIESEGKKKKIRVLKRAGKTHDIE